jgi:stringent starvation protein B
MIPVGRVMAIYARENGQGMAFPLEAADAAEPPAQEGGQESFDRDAEPQSAGAGLTDHAGDEEPEPPKPGAGHRPALKRVK